MSGKTKKAGYVSNGREVRPCDGVQHTVQTYGPISVDYTGRVISFRLAHGEDMPDIGTAVQLRWWVPVEEGDANAR